MDNKDKVLIMYNKYLTKIPNSVLRISNSGTPHLLVFRSGKCERPFASVMVRPHHPNSSKIFKIFYPWLEKDQERLYFNKLIDCISELKRLSNS